MNADDEAVARRAMSDIEASTCIRFKEREGESAYIRMSRACKHITGECIDSSASCNAEECFQGGWVQGGLGKKHPSMLFIGNTSVHISSQGDIGLLTHEILHSLGVEHTQRRPDRDAYINIKEDNIDCPYQYSKCPTCLTYNTTYDCQSVMHYRDYHCMNGGLAMTPAPGNTGCDLRSPANVLTKADIELLNKMYQCKKECCGSLNIVGYYWVDGEYVKTEELHNDKAVYKHTGDRFPYGGWCIFFGGHWKIDFCDWMKVSDESRGYIWSNVNSNCPGDIGSQWRYYSWSGDSGSGPVDTRIKVDCI